LRKREKEREQSVPDFASNFIHQPRHERSRERVRVRENVRNKKGRPGRRKQRREREKERERERVSEGEREREREKRERGRHIYAVSLLSAVTWQTRVVHSDVATGDSAEKFIGGGKPRKKSLAGCSVQRSKRQIPGF
jgi:hypothetical protein